MVKAKTKEPPEVITIIDDSEDSSSASEDFEGTNYLQDSEADMEDSAEETEDSSDFEDFGGDREEPYDNCLSFALSGKSSGACKIVPGKTSCVRCIKTRKLCTRLEVSLLPDERLVRSLIHHLTGHPFMPCPLPCSSASAGWSIPSNRM